MRRPQISSFAGTAVNRPTTTVRHYFAAAPKLMAEKWSKKAGKTVAPPCLRCDRLAIMKWQLTPFVAPFVVLLCCVGSNGNTSEKAAISAAESNESSKSSSSLYGGDQSNRLTTGWRGRGVNDRVGFSCDVIISSEL
ncbi:hypothetical protein V9T40_005970 [Parthenolecanium corni]|uniref:Uncharacterized protein n=1 Tax=Parthenolecanium corni TaxID=536013 RepID=A0AAN9U2M5_9HEMI